VVIPVALHDVAQQVVDVVVRRVFGRQSIENRRRFFVIQIEVEAARTPRMRSAPVRFGRSSP
jgi:hypothetical protein